MGKLLVIGIQDSTKKKGGSYQYKNKVNLYDPKMLILILQDLEDFGAPINKAIEIYLQSKSKAFPF